MDKKKETDIEKALYGFCRQKFKVDGKEYMAGIYYDGENLIPNRNLPDHRKNHFL